MSHDMAAISAGFAIEGEFAGAERYGNGHINDTFLAAYHVGGARSLYVHQRINHLIFRDPPAVMENVRRVCEHLSRKLNGQGARRVLRLVPARDGRFYYRDASGNYWRTYHHIAAGRSYDLVESPRQAFEAAKAFGEFTRLLSDIPGPRLNDTIPDFHDTPKRLDALEKAAKADKLGRARQVREELDFAFERREAAGLLQKLQARGDVPERVVHNDTKSNNVIIDDATGEGLCVIDLDTVMPGLALHDFGDMVRAMANRADEDERDLAKVELDLPLFEALARGYLAGAGGLLTKAERAHLAAASRILALELGMRFLTDFLEGDAYFKTHRDGHNLDRCRAQFKLARSIEAAEDAMNEIVRSAA